MKKESYTLSFNVIMVQDKTGGFTAYFKQFPNVIAEGDNENNAMKNLMNALHDVLSYQSQIQANPMNMPNTHIIEKSVNFKSLEVA